MPSRAAEPLRSTLRRALFEGATGAFAVGLGEFYFVADGVRLGAGAAELALLTTLPVFVGSGGALLVVRWLRHFPERRPVVVAAMLAQALVLLCMALADGLGRSSPASLLVLTCLYQVCGQASGTAWSSWFGELVPGRLRGSWFARRTAGVHTTTFLGLAAGGGLLHLLEGGDGRGFGLVLGLAAIARAGAAFLAWGCEERGRAAIPEGQGLLGFLVDAEGAHGRRILALTGAFLFFACTSAPFFAPFMLKVLGFDYLTYMVAQVSLVGAKVLALRVWGRLVDRFGARAVFLVGAVMVAAVPLPWLVVDGFRSALWAQVWSGVGWGAYEVALVGLVLAATDARRRPLLLAGQSLVNGSAQLGGGLLGSFLFNTVGLPYLGIFAVSAAGRLLVASLAPFVLPRLIAHSGPVAIREVGFRPHGGLGHRAVDLTEDVEP